MDIIESKYGFFIGFERNDGRCEGTMTKAARKLTGCSAVFGSADYVGSSPNVKTYPTLAAAKAALRKLEGGEG